MCGYSKFPSSNMPYKQTGAVLIMVILIVAIVAGLGIKFAGDYQLGLARAEARWHGAQARAYAFSAEGAAQIILEKDDPAYDSLDESWAVELPIEVDGGMLNVKVQDADSQFDLNLLARQPLDPNKDSLDASRYSPEQRYFIRLLQTFSRSDDAATPLVPSPAEAVAILEGIIDWIDTDSNSAGLGGAESDYYASLPEPYQAANMPFRSVEELAMVRGMTPDLLMQLKPLVSTLMPAEGLNINTVTDPRMLQGINLANELRPITLEQAQSLDSNKPSAGHYTATSEFDTTWNAVMGSGQQVDKEFLVTKTNLFWLTTTVQIGDQRRIGRSLLKRGSPQFTVVRREETSL